METKTRQGTLSDAIESVSTIDIIESFDVPHTTRRGRTYLLCPGHEDKHYGSCYVDKNDNGYYCYVCGTHVDKWHMVLQLNGNRKVDACEWFFTMSGITPVREKSDDPYRKALHLIRKLEQYVRNNPVYNDVCVCDKIDSSYGRNINGEYLYSELAVTNPLMDIYKSDKNTFKVIATQLLDTEVKKVTEKMNFYAKNDDCVYIDGVGLVSHSEMVTACEGVIANMHEVMAEIEQL
jgi:hypothetical protein